MAGRETALPKSPFGRILLNAGADRVSEEGMSALSEHVEEMAEKVASHAFEIAKNAGRKTILASDIKLAAKQILK